MTATLERVRSVRDVVSESKPRTKLSLEGEGRLWLKRPRNFLHGERAADDEHNRRLTKVLTHLDCRPLKKTEVQRHKSELLAATKAKYPDILLPSNIAMPAQIITALVFVGALLGWVACALTGLFFAATAASAVQALTASAWFGLIALGSLILHCCAGFHLKRMVKWEFQRLDDYQGKLPDFVLQTAVDIKKRMPMVDLRIDVLRVNQEIVDPFLVVIGPGMGNSHYLEVWDEKGFDISQREEVKTALKQK